MRGLTIIDSGLERAEAATPPGMAFWAGTGPAKAKCGNCVFYGYYYTNSRGKEAKRNGCREYYRMTGRAGEVLSRDQIGCKYFQEAGYEAKEKRQPG